MLFINLEPIFIFFKMNSRCHHFPSDLFTKIIRVSISLPVSFSNKIIVSFVTELRRFETVERPSMSPSLRPCRRRFRRCFPRLSRLLSRYWSVVTPPQTPPPPFPLRRSVFRRLKRNGNHFFFILKPFRPFIFRP